MLVSLCPATPVSIVPLLNSSSQIIKTGQGHLLLAATWTGPEPSTQELKNVTDPSTTFALCPPGGLLTGVVPSLGHDPVIFPQITLGSSSDGSSWVQGRGEPRGFVFLQFPATCSVEFDLASVCRGACRSLSFANPEAEGDAHCTW